MSTTINSDLLLKSLSDGLKNLLNKKKDEIIASYMEEINEKIKKSIIENAIDYDVCVQNFINNSSIEYITEVKIIIDDKKDK